MASASTGHSTPAADDAEAPLLSEAELSSSVGAKPAAHATHGAGGAPRVAGGGTGGGEGECEPEVEATRPVSMARSIGLCAFYGCTSVSITFFNKAVFSVYEFHFPCFLTLVQMIVCLLILLAAHTARLVSLPPLTARMSRTVAPLSMCWWTFVVSGLVGLRHLNVPMFSTLRKFGAVPVLVLERALLGRRASPAVWTAVGVMVAGGLLAGATDLTLSGTGVFFVAVCCLATALYLVLIVRVGEASRLDTFGLLYYNNVLALPMLLGYMALFTSEVAGVLEYRHIGSPRFWGFLLFAASQATVLNIAIFMCTKVNSPLATAVTGQAKDIVTVGVGLFMFGDLKITTPNLMGLALALLGSVLYSYVKYRESVAQRVAKQVGGQRG